MNVMCMDSPQAAVIPPDRLAVANINPKSGLATDYLNHFNEIAMLLDLFPSMPECADDVIDWQPASYQEHFEKSSFQAKDLAIQAYELIEPSRKARFEAAIAAINSIIFAAQALVASGDPRDPGLQAKLSQLRSEELQPLLDTANGMIHGVGGTEKIHEPDAALADQSEIDRLFD